MLAQCTDIMAAMVLSYILSGANSDGSGCWEWSWNICYLNREAVKAWIESAGRTPQFLFGVLLP
jgi:hypothetical protein